MSAGRGRSGAGLVVGFLVVVIVVGWWWIYGRESIDGEVFYKGERPHSMTIGPNGWFAYGDDDGEWVEHAPTGRRWGGEQLYGSPVLTSDGTAIVGLGGDVRISREAGLTEVEGSDLLVAHGDKSLQPGGKVEVIGLSLEHVAVISCMSPAGDARLDEEVAGGVLVVSGVALEDGSVTWSHDTGAGCATDLATLYPDGLPEQEYVLITPHETTTQALELDTGKVSATWQEAPRGRVIVRGDEAVHRSGDTVTVTSLRTKDEVAATTCPGARLDGTGDSGGRLAPEATPLVRCGDSVRLLGDEGFVTVDAPPVGKSQEVPDGGSVVLDRFVLARDGDTLTLRDGLTDETIGQAQVPQEYRIATNDLRGRLIRFYARGENWRSGTPEHGHLFVDTRTAAVVAETDGNLSPGAQVSTDGYAVLGELVERTRTRRSRSHAWVIGVDEVQRPG